MEACCGLNVGLIGVLEVEDVAGIPFSICGVGAEFPLMFKGAGVPAPNV